MSSYYNEHDPFAAAWLRELIKAGHIAPGDVDERSIADVRADDLTGYTQCHFFAGIGGWSYALRLAGWPDDRPVWTGSCPCQGYSTAGCKAGARDTRNLWPAWFRLIQERRPEHITGEQVAGAIGHGWLDAVSTDLEAQDYTIGAAVLGAHSVGAPHIRQRLWFVAHTTVLRPSRLSREGQTGTSEYCRMADATSAGHERRWTGETSDGRDTAREQPERLRNALSVGDSTSERGWQKPEHAGLEGPSWLQSRGSSPRGWWDRTEIIECGDGKTRVTEPGICPLAHGVSARVGRLRGYGNAIVPAVAATFIEAYMEMGA